MGVTHRFNAAVWTEKTGTRPRHIVGPFCGHICRCDRSGDLFLCLDACAARHALEVNVELVP